MGRWSRRIAPLLIDFAGIRDADRVLDVGCGTGNLAFELARNPRIKAVQGIDFSAIYVAHARRRAACGRVAFDVGDACALPYASGSFDHTLSSLALQFVPDAERAVREMRRVTRTGGTVAASTWDTRGGLVVFRMFFDSAAVIDAAAAELRARACARTASRREGLVDTWRSAGLAEVVSDSLTIRMEFASFEDFWDPLDGKDGPYAEYLRTLDPAAKTRLRGIVKAAYLDGEPDGCRAYAATAWAIKGKVR